MAKALEWLRRVNTEKSVDPLKVLGRLIETYMDTPLDPESRFDYTPVQQRNKILEVLNIAIFNTDAAE